MEIYDVTITIEGESERGYVVIDRDVIVEDIVENGMVYEVRLDMDTTTYIAAESRSMASDAAEQLGDMYTSEVLRVVADAEYSL